MSIITDMPQLLTRRTKIIATLGPSSSDDSTIRALINAGASVFRMNMSHGDHETHRTTYHKVRKAAEELNLSIAIFADLCGPKIRTGKFLNGSIELEEGQHVTVTTREVLGEPGLIPSQYKALAKDVVKGDRILLDDGKLELRVESVAGEDITCIIVYGGTLKDKKGMNLPGVNVSAPSMTDKDRADALFAMELGVEFLALSFVRCAQDIEDLREVIRSQGQNTNIIAKLEKPEALKNGIEILTATDAIMVARGDLGVELRPEDVPVAQQQLIKLAREMNKPVIIATQMLESMLENARPTRAEVTDVSSAVSAAADAVMLSAETAAGPYPVEAVQMMSRIAKQTEAWMWKEDSFGKLQHPSQEVRPLPYGDAVADATAKLCFDLRARAIVCITTGGRSAVTLSAARPAAPLIAVSPDVKVCRRMNLYWGVIPVLSDQVGHTNPNVLGREVVREQKLASKGDHIILVRGFHGDDKLNTPTITMLSV